VVAFGVPVVSGWFAVVFGNLRLTHPTT